MLSKKKFVIASNLKFISRANFVLSGVEHEKSFITSGPDHMDQSFCCVFMFQRNILVPTLVNFFFFFFFLIWVLRPFQEYSTYIEPIVHQRWAKTGEPGEKPPDHP